MKTFEYTWVTSATSFGMRADLTRELNEKGKEGWECYHIQHFPETGYTAFLKRETVVEAKKH